MELQEIEEIIKKFNAGQASDQEKALLREWYERVNGENLTFKSDAHRNALKRRLESKLNTYINADTTAKKHQIIKPAYFWMKWVAVLTIVATASFYFYIKKTERPLIASQHKKYSNDIKGGNNKAVLTLANGNKILLIGANRGVLANQGNAQINKAGDGQLVYQASAGSNALAKADLMNTIATPQGGQYMITLADGTKVWLNAASSLKFPAVFSGNERVVELSGEAYFEVAKNKKMPFRVAAAHTNIEVLGTHFNVMAYADENVQQTTLLEGSVKITIPSANGVANPLNTKVISPGQQATTASNSTAIGITSNVDTENITAWKSGLFMFDETNIEKIMQQVKRWYNAEIVYEGAKPLINFTGVMPRSDNVSKLLDALEKAGAVKFKIEGNKITVIGTK